MHSIQGCCYRLNKYLTIWILINILIYIKIQDIGDGVILW